jgi:hypothetical protein
VKAFGELGVQQLLNQFFDRAVYYSIAGYEEANEAGKSLSAPATGTIHSRGTGAGMNSNAG